MKTHFIENNGDTIKCELIKRKNSRNLRMHIDNYGTVKVSLPYYTPYLAAREFIDNNKSWIEKKLDNYKTQKDKYYYLGNNIHLIKKHYTNIKGFNYILKDNLLIVESGEFKNFTDQDLFNKWIREKALSYIPYKVKEFSEIYKFDVNSIKIKDLSSRWGSCTSKGNLTFNMKLMYFETNVIDYVIVHELCHLKEMNHSKRFWNLVGEIIPDYKKHKIKLTQPIHK